MSMHVGEALVGEGNEVAHIDLLIGSKEGPVGVAFANALARQSEGHSNLLAVLTPNLAVKPATVLITKVTEGSAAAERGLKAGDVIVEVGQEEVSQPNQVANKVREARTAGRRSVLVMVESKGAQRFVGITVPPGGG